jgi:hypothetical protein
MRRNVQWIIAVVAAAMLVSLPTVVPAKGKKKGKKPKGGGKVYIAAKAPPSSVFKKGSGNKLLAWFKSHRKLEVWERDPEDVKKKCDARCVDEETEEKKLKCHKKCTERESGWHFWICIHLKKPIDDLELTISFYDVEIFPKHHVNSFAMMLYKKGDTILTQNVKLHRPEFKANHKYMIEISSKKVTKAKQEFNLRGIPTVYSNEVNFMDDGG